MVESGVLLIQFSKCCLQNILFSHIYMWPIEFNMSGTYWYRRLLKHCQTCILISWPSISPTSKLCVYVWDLCWGLTTVFLYGFEYLMNVIRKPSWSFAQQSKGIVFLDILKSLTGPLVVMIHVRFQETHFSWYDCKNMCIFINIIKSEEPTFSPFIGFGHETMVCAVCLPMLKMVVHS